MRLWFLLPESHEILEEVLSGESRLSGYSRPKTGRTVGEVASRQENAQVSIGRCNRGDSAQRFADGI